ncbi:MAG: IclR family transcriptional regulator [Solirubrobacteraceae bacterium]
MTEQTLTPDSRRNGIQVVARVGELLRALERASAGLTLTELAGELGMPKSTVHRLVSALEAEEFVTPARLGRVRLGRGIARLGAATRGGLREELRPFLIRLQQDVDETVDLSVLDGPTIRFIDQVPAPHRLRAVSAVGAAFPLHCTANGKALLAAMPAEQVSALLPARLPTLTEHTITNRKDLWQELEQIRVSGVAVDREEHSLGICAVGAAIWDPYGPVAAMSIPVPALRFAGNEARLSEAVTRITGECSGQLRGT